MKIHLYKREFTKMDKVIYRSLVKEDYESIKKLIGEAFGFNAGKT